MLDCRGCGRLLPEELFAVDRSRSSGRRYKCRDCSAAEFKRWKDTPGYDARLSRQRKARNALKNSDPQRRWAQMAVNNAKRRAEAAGITFAIDLDWLLTVVADTCPLLGVPLNYANKTSLHDSPAIDRIDNTRGYEPSNCWVISMKANRIKSNASVSEIEAVARNLRAYLDTPPPKRYTANAYAY